MKIHADKTEGQPPHALSVRAVRCILAGVPASWIEGMAGVRLANSLDGAPEAWFNRYDRTLTIRSRGCTPKKALEAILFELAAVDAGYAKRRWHQISARESSRVRKVIAPLVEELLPVVTPPKKRFVTEPTPAFRRVV